MVYYFCNSKKKMQSYVFTLYLDSLIDFPFVTIHVNYKNEKYRDRFLKCINDKLETCIKEKYGLEFRYDDEIVLNRKAQQ